MGFEFWMGEGHGLIRMGARGGHPEVWCERDAQWEIGSPYVMDAITGMGEDPYSCGESATEMSREQAEEYAKANGIDLYAANPDDWGDTGLVAWAAKIARACHAEQVDKSGEPYIGHCTRVARKLDDDTARAVALLHDVLEDTDTTEGQLRLLATGSLDGRMAKEIVDAVVALTHVEPESRDDYYRRIRSNPLALRVKIADIHDNLEPRRLARLDDATQRRLLKKYGLALVALSG